MVCRLYYGEEGVSVMVIIVSMFIFTVLAVAGLILQEVINGN